tara:strand:+ start:628 stop:1128 length:501 start_codon:yes stop_codon:yes gene_type:complete
LATNLLYLAGGSTPTALSNITVPAGVGTVALEGLLPSFLAFGKNGALDAPQADFELTTVNGSQNGAGWRMPLAGEVTHISCQFVLTSPADVSNTVTIRLWHNGNSTSDVLATSAGTVSGGFGNSIALDPPLSFGLNDTLMAKMSLDAVGTGTMTVAEMAVLIRILN